MRLSICQYSFHRELGEGRMDLPAYFRAVKELGLDACDLHMGITGDVAENLETIRKGLSENGLTLSSYSLSNNFVQVDDAAYREQIEAVKQGLRNASILGTDTARIFGGSSGSTEPDALAADLKLVIGALKECVTVAEEVKVTLALENHGGMPGLGEEVLEAINDVGSPYLKACCDIGNFLGAGQTPEEGTRLVAPVTAYVHVKDNAINEEGEPRGRARQAIKGATVGEGIVDLEACFRILKDAGYEGFFALEYEGQEDEHTGIKKSLDFMRQALKNIES